MNFKSFASLSKYLDSIECINCGGCGFSAYFIYEFFKEKGKKPEVAMIYDDESRYETNQEVIKNNSGDPVACAHAVVKIDDLAYDSNGANKWDETLDQWSKGENLYQIVSEDFLLKAVANRKKWNDMFDRDQEVAKMEKKIGINLPKM